MTIRITDGKHFYDFEYTIPGKICLEPPGGSGRMNSL